MSILAFDMIFISKARMFFIFKERRFLLSEAIKKYWTSSEKT